MIPASEATLSRPEVATGLIYLIHFDAPIGNERGRAQHYSGCVEEAKNLTRRVGEHRRASLATYKRGHDVKILCHVNERGIGFEVVRTWTPEELGEEDVYAAEKRLKSRGGARRHCPVCRGEVFDKPLAKGE